MTRAAPPALALALLVGCATSPPPMPETRAATGPTSPPPTTSPNTDSAARNITVRIRNIPCGGGVATGTGFLIDDHTLVTNRHVVQDAASIELETWDGDQLDAEVLAVGGLADLAIVEVNRGVGESAHLAAEDPEIRENVTAIGYAEGGPQRFTTGHIIDYVTDSRLGSFGQIMRITNEIHPGNSGGPLIADTGEVVGVVYAIELATDYGLAIPVTTLRRMIDRGENIYRPAC